MTDKWARAKQRQKERADRMNQAEDLFPSFYFNDQVIHASISLDCEDPNAIEVEFKSGLESEVGPDRRRFVINNPVTLIDLIHSLVCRYNALVAEVNETSEKVWSDIAILESVPSKTPRPADKTP